MFFLQVWGFAGVGVGVGGCNGRCADVSIPCAKGAKTVKTSPFYFSSKREDAAGC